MQIGAAPAPMARPEHIAAALATAAGRLGHRPAVTVLHDDRREEQGYASLAQWAAKGAHLLSIDLLLEPGDLVTLVGPPGWLPVAVAHACWWAGIAVTTGPAPVAVVHEGWDVPPHADDVLRFGDAVDGSPTAVAPGEPWPVAVQAFPDQPPPPRATASTPALVTADGTRTHAQLLDDATAWGDRGALGVDAAGDVPLERWLAAVAVRPLLTARASVVLRGATRDAAEPEGVDRWIVAPPGDRSSASSRGT